MHPQQMTYVGYVPVVKKRTRKNDKRNGFPSIEVKPQIHGRFPQLPENNLLTIRVPSSEARYVVERNGSLFELNHGIESRLVISLHTIPSGRNPAAGNIGEYNPLAKPMQVDESNFTVSWRKGERNVVKEIFVQMPKNSKYETSMNVRTKKGGGPLFTAYFVNLQFEVAGRNELVDIQTTPFQVITAKQKNRTSKKPTCVEGKIELREPVYRARTVTDSRRSLKRMRDDEEDAANPPPPSKFRTSSAPLHTDNIMLLLRPSADGEDQSSPHVPDQMSWFALDQSDFMLPDVPVLSNTQGIILDRQPAMPHYPNIQTEQRPYTIYPNIETEEQPETIYPTYSEPNHFHQSSNSPTPDDMYLWPVDTSTMEYYNYDSQMMDYMDGPLLTNLWNSTWMDNFFDLGNSDTSDNSQHSLEESSVEDNVHAQLNLEDSLEDREYYQWVTLR